MSDTARGIDVQAAVKVAREHMKKIFGTVVDLQLEEVDQSEDESHWLITFGFLRPEPVLDPFMAAVAAVPKMTRVYKIVVVDSHSGKATSVKIRKL